jgi:NAD(P)-dependent dehydrogenase (short-subunit alcohol dehydrogenase family)
MDLNLSGRVVLVTGGSKGIGLACAEAFCAEGARVAICSRSDQNLAAAVKKLTDRGHAVHPVSADLARRDAAAPMVRHIEERLGPIDVLVCSAGAARRTPPDKLDEAAWHAGMDAKFFATVHAMQAVIPGMAARGRGAVIALVGQGGKIANPAHLAGGSANAALMLATAGLASAYGPAGVRVNAINPGTTLTERAQAAFKVDAERLGLPEEKVRAQREGQVPLRRFARPEEIAQVVLFLASDRASYVTGAILSMDGGTGATVV